MGKASAFLTVPALSALAWIGFFVAVYGAPDPASPYRGSDLGSPAYIPGGLGGILFDQMYGVLVYAPVFAAAVAGSIALWRRGGQFRWLPVELLFVLLPYLLTVTHFAMWWGGWSAPARFLLPVLPSLGVTVAAAWSAARRPGTRAFLRLLLACTIVMAGVTVLAGDGSLGYFPRDNVYSPSLEWMNRLADLGRGFPAFFAGVRRGRPADLFFEAIAVWVAAGILSWLFVRSLGDRLRVSGPSPVATASLLVTACAAMVSLTIVWRLERVQGLTTGLSEPALLRASVFWTSYVGLDLSTRRTIPAGAWPSGLSIDAEIPAQAASLGRGDRPIVVLPALPSGIYRMTATMRAPGGWLLMGVGRDQFALVSQPAERFVGTLEVTFPVDVRGVFVRGDEDARERLSFFRMRPLRLFDRASRAVGGTARHGVRYGPLVVFFMDEHAFPEPGGFWVHGGRTATVALQTPGRASVIPLRLRNAPVDNRITLKAGDWRETLRLSAGEERRIEVPADPSRAATALSLDVETGFRPSEVEPGATDGRFLGLWVSAEPPAADQNLTTPPK